MLVIGLLLRRGATEHRTGVYSARLGTRFRADTPNPTAKVYGCVGDGPFGYRLTLVLRPFMSPGILNSLVHPQTIL